MTILPFAHEWQNSFDDVHICEEVDLEDLVDQASCSAGLREFFHGADHGCTHDMSVSLNQGGQGHNLRSQRTTTRRCAQTLRQLQQQLPGIDQPLYNTTPVSDAQHPTINPGIKYSPTIQPNNPQMLAPSVRLFHILQKRPKILTLPFSFFKLQGHNARNNIIAMFQHLSR